MNQASARFEQYLNRRFPHSTTPKHYRSDLHIVITLIGDKPPTDVKAEDNERFVEKQLTAELKPSTINRRHAALQLHQTGGRRALATMCIGVGQGIAIAIERL